MEEAVAAALAPPPPRLEAWQLLATLGDEVCKMHPSFQCAIALTLMIQVGRPLSA